LSASQEVASKLTSAGEQLRKAAVSMRNVCIDLYPPLIEQGVNVVVSEILHQFESEYGLDINYRAALDGESWPNSDQITSTVRRVLSESLNNIVKHAKGANVEVNLNMAHDNQLILQIVDDGPGSRTVGLSFSELVRQGHLGIVGMHEWAQEIGGTLKIFTNEPSGTTVLLSCPL
jgi:signal transduction histidine kinase